MNLVSFRRQGFYLILISPTDFIKKIHKNSVNMDTAVLITTNCPASSPSPPIFCAMG